jgi:hypothetical protein
MRYLVKLLILLFVIGSHMMANPDCENATNRSFHVSIAQVHERLIKSPWPLPPKGAKIEGYAIFQISVSTKGTIDCINSIGGHPLLLSQLNPIIKHWTFRTGLPFLGVIVVRYASEGYRLL